MTQPTNTDYKQKCLDIYYASDVVDKTLSFGCLVKMKKQEGDDMDMVNWSVHEPVPVVSMSDGFAGIERMQYVDNFGIVATAGMERAKDEDGEVIDDAWVESEGGYEADIEEIIGHPPTLASWLRLVQGKKSIAITQTGSCIEPDNTRNGTRPVDLSFNLTTEEPTDWQALYKIIQ